MRWCSPKAALLLFVIFIGIAPSIAPAAISLGPLSDFQDGTFQGWSGNSDPTIIAGGGPAGSMDNYLRIGGKFANRFAIFNLTSGYNGAVDPGVTAFQADLMRPAGASDILEMRLVLFAPNTGIRWTSADAQTVPGDGIWRAYTFSLLESDLTQVQGSDTYDNLISNVGRVMFRHDPAPPEADGIEADGFLGIDNVAAVPEPAAPLLLTASIALIAFPRRKSR
jgi:hypothetical protein